MQHLYHNFLGKRFILFRINEKARANLFLTCVKSLQDNSNHFILSTKHNFL